jgi:hypothetical protein
MTTDITEDDLEMLALENEDDTIRLRCSFGLIEICKPGSSPTSRNDLLLLDAIVGQLRRIYGRQATLRISFKEECDQRTLIEFMNSLTREIMED